MILQAECGQSKTVNSSASLDEDNLVIRSCLEIEWFKAIHRTDVMHVGGLKGIGYHMHDVC